MFRERRLFHVGLGAELRRFRELSGMSTRMVATKLGTSPAWVSRTETGTRRPTAEEVVALCALYGVTGETRDRLVEKARDVPGEVVGLPVGDDYADQLANIMVLENEAAKVTEYGLALIPGLLQIADYARPIFSTVDRSQAEIERRIATRIGRQTLLSRPNGPELDFVIDEFALHRTIGGTSVMRRQLHYLADCAEWSHANLFVVPATAGAYGGLDGPFIAYEFGALNPYVQLANRKGGIFLTDPAETCEYLELCGRLRELAYDPRESVELIRVLAGRLSDDGS